MNQRQRVFLVLLFLAGPIAHSQEYDAWLGNEYETTWFWKIYAKESIKAATGEFGAVSGYIGDATITDPLNLYNNHDLETILMELASQNNIQDASMANIESRILGSNLMAITADIVSPGKSITHTVTEELASRETILAVLDAHCGIRIPPRQWTITSSTDSDVMDTVSTTQTQIWFEEGYQLSMLLRLSVIPYVPEYGLRGQGIYHDMVAKPQDHFQSRGRESL